MEHPLAISHRSSSSLRPLSHGLKSSQIPPVLDFPDASPEVPHKEKSPQTNPSPTFTSNTGSTSHIKALRQATEFTFIAGYPSHIEPIAMVAVLAQHHAASGQVASLLPVRVKHHCHRSYDVICYHWSFMLPQRNYTTKAKAQHPANIFASPITFHQITCQQQTKSAGTKICKSVSLRMEEEEEEDSWTGLQVCH